MTFGLVGILLFWCGVGACRVDGCLVIGCSGMGDGYLSNWGVGGDVGLVGWRL